MKHLIHGFAGIIATAVVFSILQCISPNSDLDTGERAPCDSTNTGYFDVTSPQLDQSLKMGSQDSIMWSMLNSAADSIVSLYLYKGQALVETIAVDLRNEGRLSWNVPRIGKDHGYRIKICNSTDTTRFNYGCPFSLYGYFGHFTIISPVISQTCTSGASIQIQWESNGFPGDSVSLTLYINKTLQSLIAGRTGNSGSYTWLIPSDLSLNDTFRIKITSYSDSGISAISEAFKIVDSADTMPDSVRDSAAVFISPTDTTVITTGESYRIQWKPDSALLGTLTNISLYKGSKELGGIASSVPNSGSFSYAIDPKLEPGSDYRIRITNAKDTLQNFFSPFFTIQKNDSDTTVITEIKPDAYEPDDQRDSASTLDTLGVKQFHSLTVNDTDWIKVYLEGPREYLVQCYGDIAMGIYLFHEDDPSHATYFFNSYQGSSMAWRFPKSGYWYMRVAALSCLESWTYWFTVKTLDANQSVSFTSPAPGVTWYSGSTYKIEWRPDSAFLGTNVDFYLYKGSKQYASISENVNNSGVYAWDVPFGLPVGNDYSIKIVNHAFVELFCYTPCFTVNGMSSDAYEPDNTLESASTLSPLGQAQSHTLMPDDIDWVKFSLDSGRAYKFLISGTIAMNAIIYKSGQTDSVFTFNAWYLGSTNLYSNAPGWTCDASGLYYACISACSTNTTLGGTYSFNVSPFDSLNTVTFMSPTAGSVWNTGSPLTIQWSLDSALFGLYTRIELYKGNSRIYSITSSICNGFYSWNVPTGLSTGSDYRIRIASTLNNSLASFSPLFTINGITPDLYEPDDTISTASTIVVDGPAQSRSLSYRDVDWIRFTAAIDSVYMIEIVASEDNGSLPYLQKGIYEYEASKLVLMSSNFIAGDSKIVWLCPKSGTYYLCVYASSYCGNYTTAIKRDSITINCNFINPTEQSVWSAGSSYQIQWTPDTAFFGQGIKLQLYRGAASIMDIESCLNTGACPFTIPLGMETGNNYSIRLMGEGSNFIFKSSPQFTIDGVSEDAYEDDDSPEFPHEIAVTGTPEEHSLTLFDRYDFFTFQADAQYLYEIKTTGATSSMLTVINLFDESLENGSVLAYSNIADSSATILKFYQEAGTNFFLVTSSTFGAYQIRVTAYDSTMYGLGLASPQGGDSLTIGQTDTIRWSSQFNAGGNVGIFLYNETGAVQTIAENAPNNGAYPWTVPAAVSAGGDYYIIVKSRVEPNIRGRSGTFTIKGN